MNTSFNRNIVAAPMPPARPVSEFQYREIPSLPRVPYGDGVRGGQRDTPAAEVEMTHAELEQRLAAARAEGAKRVEAKYVEDAKKRAEAEAARISGAVAAFGEEQKKYFARVENEVVRLALSVAAKILHRESQVDPMLVAALVQVALNQLRENTAVTVRVHPAEVEQWKAHFAAQPQVAEVSVMEDKDLERGDCLLETELGQANFSLAAQLKEVEQGFFDLLAQTPRSA